MEKTRRSKVKKNPKLLIAASACGAVAVVAGSAWGIAKLQRHHMIHAADEYLKKGFAALAVEEVVEPHRYTLTRSAEGCVVALNAYYQAHRAERLEWASQTCLDSGIETPETIMGYAASRELTGRDNDALQILGQSLGKFEKSADIYYRMALIFKRNKRDAETTAAYLKASELAGSNAQISLEAMQYFMEAQRWDYAKQMADRIRGVETDNPEVKLVIARAYQRAGDKGSAQNVLEQAKALLSKKPEQVQKALQQSYADVLNGGGRMADAGKPEMPGTPGAPGMPPQGAAGMPGPGLADGHPAPLPMDASRGVASDGRPLPPMQQGPPAGEPNGAHPPRKF